jgi:ribonuclease HI
MSKQLVRIYTDGACRGNPGGPGGIGAVLLWGSRHRKEISIGYANTTNNRMELRAVLHALEQLRHPCVVNLCSDSRYIVDAFRNRWIARWADNGWRRGPKRKDNLANADLWQQIWEVGKAHSINVQWVRGHNGNPENERCDRLANQAIDSGVLNADERLDVATGNLELFAFAD